MIQQTASGPLGGREATRRAPEPIRDRPIAPRAKAPRGRVVLFALALGWAAGPAVAGAAEVYVPLGSANAVAVVDTESHQVVGRIEGLPQVHGLAATPDGRYLIAGSYQTRAPGAATPEKPAGVSADEHAAHHAPGGAMKAEATTAAAPLPSSLSVVRLSDRAVVRRIDVPGAVHHVRTDPLGRYAAVTHPEEGTISVVDLAGFALVATVETGALPNYLAFSADGTRLYVSNAGDDTVSDIDTRRWRVERSIAVGAGPEHIVLSPDGRRLFTNNVEAGSVSVVDLGQGTVEQTLSIGDSLHGIDLSSDGATLFVAALGADALLAIDLGSGARRSLALAPAPYHVAAVGDDTLYVSSADRPVAWVVDRRTLTLEGEIPLGGRGHQMALTGAAGQ